MSNKAHGCKFFTKPFFRVMGLLLVGCNNAPVQGPSPPTIEQQAVIVAPPESALPPATSVAPASPLASAADVPRTSQIPLADAVNMDPEKFKPQRLQLILTDTTDIIGMLFRQPYLSVDGSTGVVLIDSDAGFHRQTLVVRALDGRGKDMDLPLLNHPCEIRGVLTCDTVEAEKRIRIANELLAKHSWVMFRQYVPDDPKTRGNGCGDEDLTRHFRILDYEVFFREPRLRIVREDGVVITDSNHDVHDPAESQECRRGTRPYAGTFGIDVERRAMAASLMSCRTDGCGAYERFFFFRLPPPKREARAQ